MDAQLTGDVRAGTELCSHLRVHGDHHLLLGAHYGVPLLHLVVNPVSELVAENGGTNVHNELLGHLDEIKLIREKICNAGLFDDKRENAFDRKVLVLRDKERLHSFVGNIALLLRQDVFEEVNCGVVCEKQRMRKYLHSNVPYGGK